MLMVKPGLPYLDVILRLRQAPGTLPTIASSSLMVVYATVLASAFAVYAKAAIHMSVASP